MKSVTKNKEHENLLFNKKINAYTVEKLIRHNTNGKIEPANKMIEAYYARREKELSEARNRREKATKTGIYNFSTAKYQDIFADSNQKNSKSSIKKINHGKNETDTREVIDLFDIKNKDKKPDVIVYDNQKGIYVLKSPIESTLMPSESLVTNNKTIAQKKLLLQSTKITDNRKKITFGITTKITSNPNKKDKINKQVEKVIKIKNLNEIEQKRKNPYLANVIDPAKRPNFINEIQNDIKNDVVVNAQLNQSLLKKNILDVALKDKNKKIVVEKFNRQEFLKILTAKKNKDQSFPNFAQYQHGASKPKRPIINFFTKVTNSFGKTKISSQLKQWNK